MSRRQFVQLGSAAALGAAGLFALTGCDPQTMSEASESSTGSPNILFVFPDELRPHALGCYGNRQCRTPLIDSLAEEGVVFDSACSPYPVCSPARASLLTGLYPHANGEVENGVTLDLKYDTLAEGLNAAGYECAYVGKWHLGGQEGKIIPEPYRHGFNAKWLITFGNAFKPNTYPCNEDDRHFTVDQWRGDYEADQVIEFIQREHTKPWFMVYSPLQPHTPYQMPDEYLHMYDPKAMQLRPNVSDESFKEEYAKYYGFVTWTDDLLARIVAELKSTGQYENTLIVISSDHGWNMGSHEKRGKRSIFEESCRIPCIFAGGAVPEAVRGTRTDVPVTICDYMPTFLELAQAPVPKGLHGDSLAGHLTGKDPLDRESVYVEVLWTPKPKPAFDPPRRAVRSRRYKYVEEDGKPAMLFDLKSDPYEMNNRLDDPELCEVQSGLREQFRYWHQRTGDPWPGKAWDLWKPEKWDRANEK